MNKVNKVGDQDIKEMGCQKFSSKILLLRSDFLSTRFVITLWIQIVETCGSRSVRFRSTHF